MYLPCNLWRSLLFIEHKEGEKKKNNGKKTNKGSCLMNSCLTSSWFIFSFYYSVLALIYEHVKCCFSFCSTSFWCCNQQSIPLPHNSARERQETHSVLQKSSPTLSCHMWQAQQVAELWNQHFLISLKGFAFNSLGGWQKVQMERKRFSFCVQWVMLLICSRSVVNCW